MGERRWYSPAASEVARQLSALAASGPEGAEAVALVVRGVPFLRDAVEFAARQRQRRSDIRALGEGAEMSGTPWTPEEERFVERAEAAGMPVEDVAKALRRSYHAVENKRSQLRCGRAGRVRGWEEEECEAKRAAARALARKGLPDDAIAERLCVDTAQARKWTKWARDRRSHGRT